MDKHYFIELLNKYLEGRSTEDENRFLISYYNLFELEPEVEALLDAERKKQIKKQIKENIWKNIEAKESSPGKHAFLNNWIIKAAAAAIIITLCTTAIFFAVNRPSNKQNFVSLLNTQKENRLIHLPDGSTAIVNIGSTLRYPSSFDQLDTREVYLEGEAFFDISHNPSKPFIVHTGSLQTTVLGTAFNVKALPVDSEITVIVTRGKVKISNGDKTICMVTKGEEMVCHKRNDVSAQKTATGNLNLDWKKQDLFLDDVTVEDAAKLLEDRFDITISFTDTAIKNNRFTTVFLKDEGIEQVLKSICEFNGAQYEYDKKTNAIIISKNSTLTN